ncbi:MAG: 30S ribosomal protein S20 [Gemmatimonadetes bacterium]|nr:30S ribosomal protein S20 [Gemmatimonadota bacterium]
MANIKSAKKRIRTSEIRASRNKAQRSRLKTLVKRVRQATEPQAALAEFRAAVSFIDRAARTRIIHPNRAARLKGQLARHLQRVSG